MRANPWMCGAALLKSLMLEQNSPTVSATLSTDCASNSTNSSILSTGAFFDDFRRPYLSLSFLKENREEKSFRQKTAIHGFEQLPKKVATGYKVEKCLIRGFPWIGSTMKSVR